ncbi:hypothetical protein BCD48_10410 [Pseudofrankia sp. BMG5.36]|nr:hypothetical protein [Pseudofrankia sp. BMG5.37]OHV50682.1 hypothetical protein BCD48_10410 [Pseudofrankia sp. BMG5.36]
MTDLVAGPGGAGGGEAGGGGHARPPVVIEVSGATKTFVQRRRIAGQRLRRERVDVHAVRDVSFTVRRGDHRLPGPERRREEHDDQDADRGAHAERGPAAGRRA